MKSPLRFAITRTCQRDACNGHPHHLGQRAVGPLWVYLYEETDAGIPTLPGLLKVVMKWLQHTPGEL